MSNIGNNNDKVVAVRANAQKRGKKRKPAKMYHNWQYAPISFPKMQSVDFSEMPIVISCKIADADVTIMKVHVDNGSSADIIYEQCFAQLPENIKTNLQTTAVSLTGFAGESSLPIGVLPLHIELVDVNDDALVRRARLDFYVMRASSRYNMLLGRIAISKFRIVPSTIHGMIKFPTYKGVATIRSMSVMPICAAVNIKPAGQEPVDATDVMEIINPAYPEQKIKVGRSVSADTRKQIVQLLVQYMDVFAWCENDMTGVPRHIAEHRLNVNPALKPVVQKRRGMAPDRVKWLCEEVTKLVRAGILREAQYQSWIANPVLVKKPDGSWRMCIDYKDLNKACPKDNYPLPEIDLKVESLHAFPYKCFLDAARGYHQIPMAQDDADKTAFHTGKGIYCYIMMPFGLINAGATYQRLIDTAFDKQIGRNLEAYVDDLVIKSTTQERILEDMRETFDTLRNINMKLNPLKCSFGETEGKFLGYLVTEQGIQANPKKIAAIENMTAPKTVKEVQSLTGRLAALTRFLSKAAERQLPFFKTLKGCLKQKSFVWTSEAETAFQEMKKLLKTLPTLTAPVDGEILYLYISVANEAFGSVLIAERNKIQKPVYFVSKALTGSEINYAPIEKFVYALILTSRRLRRYFQGHPVHVLTNMPIKQVLTKPEVSGRLALWAVELGAYQISYLPRSAVKGQVMADYLAEMSGELEVVNERIALKQEVGETWDLFTDGASCAEGAGAGLVLASPSGEEHTYALRFNFDVTNNEAEYEALLAGLNIARKMNIVKLRAFTDSQLVANQFNGFFEAHDPSMQKYLQLLKETAARFEHFELAQVPRSQNKKADALSKLAALTFSHFQKQVWVEELPSKSIDSDLMVASVTEEQPNWMEPILQYIRSDILPEDSREARLVRERAPMYIIQDDILYRKSYCGPMMRCVGPIEAEMIVEEVHNGTCALHSGYKTIAAKIMRMGYFWPSLYRDVAKIVKRCKSCQRHAPQNRMPRHDMIPVNSPWPFNKWAIDIVGPFPAGPGNVKFLIVAIDYFTKWVEAKAVRTITGVQVRNFVWEYIVCRFGIPRELVSDNGAQIAKDPFKKWCTDLNIIQKFTSVAHPQANGLCEVTNRDIVSGIKKRLCERRTGWVDELPNVLWAHRTTFKKSTGETPFSLVYGSEAVIPAEILVPTHRIANFEEEANDAALSENLNFIEERRLMAAIREANNKQQIAKYYNKRVRALSFAIGEWVLRNNEASRAEKLGKLGPNWEGPYQVVAINAAGSYKLADVEGRTLPNAWHAVLLKRYYA